jgi:hypothetical protein
MIDLIRNGLGSVRGNERCGARGDDGERSDECKQHKLGAELVIYTHARRSMGESIASH